MSAALKIEENDLRDRYKWALDMALEVLGEASRPEVIQSEDGLMVGIGLTLGDRRLGFQIKNRQGVEMSHEALRKWLNACKGAK